MIQSFYGADVHENEVNICFETFVCCSAFVENVYERSSFKTRFARGPIAVLVPDAIPGLGHFVVQPFGKSENGKTAVIGRVFTKDMLLPWHHNRFHFPRTGGVVSAVTWITEQMVRAGLYPYHFPREESSNEMASFPKVFVYIIFFAQEQIRSWKHEKQSDSIVIYEYVGTRYLGRASADQIIHRRRLRDMPAFEKTYARTADSAISRQQGCPVLIWRFR